MSAKEGVGETSDETVRLQSEEGQLPPVAIRQKSYSLFVRCGSSSPQFHVSVCSRELRGEISILTCSPTPSFFSGQQMLRARVRFLTRIVSPNTASRSGYRFAKG
jgi:hypothetical protein